MEEEMINGCLGLGSMDTDYPLCDGFEDALPQLYQQDEVIFEYNQSKQDWSKKSCTIFSAIGAISDLFNYKFSLEEIKEIDDISYTWGRFKNSWWWVQSAVKLVADRWNANPSLFKEYWKVAYYKIDTTNNELLDKILDKGYNVMTNINGNTKYTLDYLRDAMVDDTEFGGSTYGHALNLVTVNLKKIGWVVCVKDNYKGRTTNNGKMDCNIYALAHYPREISVFGTNGYIYTKVAENNIGELKRLNEMNTVNELLMENNSKMRHLTNNQKLKDKLHDMNNQLRKTKVDIENEIKKLM